MSDFAMRMRALVVFRKLLAEPVVARLLPLLEATPGTPQAMDAYGAFVAALLAHTDNWTQYLLQAALQEENLYVVKRCSAAGANAALQVALAEELEFLQRLGEYDAAEHRAAAAFLPAWRTEELDFAAAYAQRLQDVRHTGYGVFARHHVFTVSDGKLVPVQYPDPQRLDELTGYERERKQVIANTEALLAGQPANNVLLYGDAGTGKSSTVKAVANAYAAKGLRLVEVKKNQLYQIPALVDELAANPLKFILFIDDLSFAANDDNFAALKAILEGSVGGRSQNLAVYATSNRRHLIKETLSDREGDDIHHGDTMQELMSLSARFGLTVTYSRPDKAEYLAIVDALAQQYGVKREPDELHTQAEAFAIRSGGRSPRVGKQFVQLLRDGVV